jgi:decaprenylphospho-beta-D-erythro-pentofuranosid-2-ulose 2-reductase
MKNGMGNPGTIVLFGGTSEIGRETVLSLLAPGVENLVLVSRDVEAASQNDEVFLVLVPNLNIFHITFDGADALSMPEVVAEIVSEVGDIDIAIVAHAVLGDEVVGYVDPAGVSQVITVNMTATITLLYALASQMRTQGHGRIALFSSVAGERVRKGNAVYGSSKAGVDSFALALDHDLEGTGVSVVVIRPGFVPTKMTRNMEPAPFATTAHAVGVDSAKAIKGTVKIIWSPKIMRPLFILLRHLPTKLWRRVSS